MSETHPGDSAEPSQRAMTSGPREDVPPFPRGRVPGLGGPAPLTSSARLRGIDRMARQLQVAAVLGSLALLAIHLGVTYAVTSELEPIVVAVDVVIAGLVVVAALLFIARLTRERRRHAVVEDLVGAFAQPSDVNGTAGNAARVLVGSGLVESCLIAVTQDDGGQRDALVVAATAGYPGGWIEDAPARPVPTHPTLERPQREHTAGDAWLVPVAAISGGRSWVARVPVVRNDEVLGLALLTTRRRGQLDDSHLLATIGAQIAGALDHARLHQAAYERTTSLEEQESRRREFLFAIAHELRSPLTSIQTFAELLQSDHEPEDDTAELLLSSLSRGVDRLATFINDLLDLGRVQETDVQVALAPVNVTAVLRGAEEMLRPSFMIREQALSIELPDEPLTAIADERALEQVLLNLLSNANRFTPELGAVVVRGSLQGDRVHVEIEDSGPGIDALDRQAIFEAFYRVQRDGAPEVPGSGLGLAVAHRLTELQGGRIWVEDARAAETGSCFCLDLEATSIDQQTYEVPDVATRPAAMESSEPDEQVASETDPVEIQDDVEDEIAMTAAAPGHDEPEAPVAGG